MAQIYSCKTCQLAALHANGSFEFHILQKLHGTTGQTYSRRRQFIFRSDHFMHTNVERIRTTGRQLRFRIVLNSFKCKNHTEHHPPTTSKRDHHGRAYTSANTKSCRLRFCLVPFFQNAFRFVRLLGVRSQPHSRRHTWPHVLAGQIFRLVHSHSGAMLSDNIRISHLSTVEFGHAR